ncbi:MAG TPA: hypothetical protein VKA21_08000, partial [Candidatus Binatia bacterium]|nr:hypothetical protein [Candidatus Binatia bacterium]
TTTETLASTTTTTVPPGVTFGNAVEFPDASAHAPDYLLGSPVTLPAPMTVTRLCLIAKGDGPNVVMVLYSSDNFGRPMHPVAWTPTTPLTAGRMEIPVSPTVLAAGRYWITAVYDTDASVGIDETDPLAPVDYVDHPFSSPAPDPFGAAASYTGQKFNYYVRAQ